MTPGASRLRIFEKDGEELSACLKIVDAIIEKEDWSKK